METYEKDGPGKIVIKTNEAFDITDIKGSLENKLREKEVKEMKHQSIIASFNENFDKEVKPIDEEIEKLRKRIQAAQSLGIT